LSSLDVESTHIGAGVGGGAGQFAVAASRLVFNSAAVMLPKSVEETLIDTVVLPMVIEQPVV
jgi:hypothetical protein